MAIRASKPGDWLILPLKGWSTRKLGRPWLSRSASEVPPYSITEIARYARNLGYEDFVYLNIGEPDFETPAHIREAGVKAIREGKTHYTTDIGISELRDGISKKLSTENNLDFSPNDITVVSGSQEGIAVLAQTLFDPGDSVIVSDPYYPSYVQNIELRGARLKTVPLRKENGFQMCAEDVRKAVDSRTKAIVIVSPNNPTGGMQDETELRGIADIAIENDLVVISDEIYEYITYGSHRHVSIGSLPGMQNRTIIQNGFSKAYAMTGWRIGFVATPPEITQKFQEVHRATVICPPSVSQYAALAALQGTKESVQRMVKEFGERRSFVMKRVRELDDVEANEPAGAFYLFPDFSSYTADDHGLALDLIREAHVVTVHGSGFGEQGRGRLRISFAASMERLDEGFNRIESFLKKFRN